MKRKSKILFMIPGILCICVLLAYAMPIFYDYTVLMNSEYFADGPIGYSGSRPYALDAFFRLKANPFAEYIFKHLERSGTGPAKAYAIIALRDISPAYARGLQDKYLENRETTMMMSGCIMYSEYLFIICRYDSLLLYD